MVAWWGMLSVSLLSGGQYWQQNVSYKMQVSFDPENHRLSGIAHIRYKNNSPDSLQNIYFHLFPNSFRHGSVMEREAKKSSMILIHSPDETGWLRVQDVNLQKAGSQRGNLKKISYNEDSTIVCFHLKKPLYPQEWLTISLKFNLKIRKFNLQYDRGGYSGNLFEMSQWYPKVCVYDEHGWDADPNHFLGEFYGEFGSYNVTIEAPGNYIIAATGEVVEGDPGWRAVAVTDSNQSEVPGTHSVLGNVNHKRRVTFSADLVHDFVWTTSPNYVYETDTIQAIPVHVLYKKSEKKTWHKNALLAARHTLEWLRRHIGEFPYPQLTLAQGLTDGGMEYPMVTVLGYYDFFLVFHEISHMYFYAAVANNEQNNAWMDEGVVTYLTSLFQKEKYPADYAIKPYLRFPFSLDKFAKLSTYNKVRLNSLYYYLYSGYDRPMNSPCYLTGDYYIYNYHAYIKPSQFFAILDFLLGREKFFKMLRDYYHRWKFKHVEMSALQQSCEIVSGRKWDEFFQKWIYDIPKVDYAVRDFRSEKKGDGRWETRIHIRNLGNTDLPTEVELVTNAGDTVIDRIFDKGFQDEVILRTNSKVKRVWLDPRDVILDQNRMNNGNVRYQWFFYPGFPSMYYLPRDAYALLYFPNAWYNDIDGFKPGFQLLGTYLNRYYISRSHIWYNTKKENFDYQFSYSMPWEQFGKNVWRHLQWQQIDGKRAVSANVQVNRYHSMTSQPVFTFRAGFQHYKLTDTSRNYDEVRMHSKNIPVVNWEPGALNQLFLRAKYTYWKKIPNFSIELKSVFSDRAFDSDFNYLKASLKLKMSDVRLNKNTAVDVHSFLGISSSENVPIQDRFGVAGASPIQQLNYFYLRSPNFLKSYLHYHLPGDANLRGYSLLLGERGEILSADKIVAGNVQLKHNFSFHYLPKKWRTFLPRVVSYLFFDGGLIWGRGEKKDLFDAGVGILLSKSIRGKVYRLRFDFPLYLNQPNLSLANKGEGNWQFRWMISFQ